MERRRADGDRPFCRCEQIFKWKCKMGALPLEPGSARRAPAAPAKGPRRPPAAGQQPRWKTTCPRTTVTVARPTSRRPRKGVFRLLE